MGKQTYTDPNDPSILAQNALLQKWSSMVVRKLKCSAGQFTHGKIEGMVIRGKGASQHQEAKLKDNIGYKLHKNYGLVEGVGIKFERHGVFVHKGVGRGYIVMNGTVIRGYRNSDAAKKTGKDQNRRIVEKTATSGDINRKPVDWFNPVLEPNVEKLADELAELTANAVLNMKSAYIK